MAKHGGLKGLRSQGNDVAKLVIDYLKQETVGPLKDLGRFVAYGTIGSLFLAGGLVLLLVSVLRLLQGETVLTGNLSWIPYLIVGVLAAGIIAIASWRIVSGPAKRRLPKPEAKR
ncbi:MAG: phage holin family protein [Actinomycetes bacterium]